MPVAITYEEIKVGNYSAKPDGVVNTEFFDTQLHQWESFIFPLISNVMYGKLHVDSMNCDQKKQKCPEKKSFHPLYKFKESAK